MQINSYSFIIYLHYLLLVITDQLHLTHGFAIVTLNNNIKPSLNHHVLVSHNILHNNNHKLPSTTTLSSSKDDEIAALEEKLRKLKQDAAIEKENEEAMLLLNNNSSNDEPLEEMLSEKWKESELSRQSSDNGGNDLGGGIVKIAGGLALIVAIAIFSQVPVGQEGLDKYSTPKQSTTIDLGDLNPVKMNKQYDL